MSEDNLGDRMKAYESEETDRVFDASRPLVVRLDGRAFSTFTRGMNKPFDDRLIAVMDEVTAALVDANHAVIGYTQSDEITLIFDRSREEAQPIFGGRLFKVISLLAGMASARFALLAATVWPERVARSVPMFDCRAFGVPSRVEAVNALVWRELDASRNAVQAVAQAHFSPKQMHGRSCDVLETMLAERGVAMSDYPIGHRLGRYFARRTMEVELAGADLERIPERHRPTGPVLRSRVLTLDLAPIVLRPDRVDLVFRP